MVHEKSVSQILVNSIRSLFQSKPISVIRISDQDRVSGIVSSHIMALSIETIGISLNAEAII